MRQTQTDTWDMRRTKIPAAKIVSGITDSVDGHRYMRQTHTQDRHTRTRQTHTHETDTHTLDRHTHTRQTHTDAWNMRQTQMHSAKVVNSRQRNQKHTLSKVVTES